MLVSNRAYYFVCYSSISFSFYNYSYNYYELSVFHRRMFMHIYYICLCLIQCPFTWFQMLCKQVFLYLISKIFFTFFSCIHIDIYSSDLFIYYSAVNMRMFPIFHKQYHDECTWTCVRVYLVYIPMNNVTLGLARYCSIAIQTDCFNLNFSLVSESSHYLVSL